MYGLTVQHAAVLGGGSFGTALAAVLGQKHGRVSLWSNEPDVVESVQKQRENPKYLEGVSLPACVVATLDLSALASAELVVIAVPSHAVREVLSSVRKIIHRDAIVVCAAKGIEVDTLDLMSDVCDASLDHPQRIAYLSGPSFAREVAEGLPTNVLIAARLEATAVRAQQLVSMPYFRCYTSTDVTGIEIAGAAKNVYAIAAGCLDGMGLGLNARAALITRGLNEMTRVGVALGADQLTFAGLAGVGDLVLTCTGALSRNRQLGVLLGQGRTLTDALAEVRTVAEGVKTAQALYRLAMKHELDLPIATRIYRVLFEKLEVHEALRQLMARELKPEWS